MRADLWLLGYHTYAVPMDGATALFEWWRAHGFTPKVLIRDEKKGEIRFTCSYPAVRRYLKDSPDAPGGLKLIASGGLPFLICHFLHRPGLIVGALLAIVLLISSHLFVWDVRVEGNETVAADELYRELAAAGLERGSFLPRLEKDTVVTALRRGDSRIAYATINVSGTVAYVQVRESEQPTDEKKVAPANLVARCDGTVTMPLIFAGQCLVAEGEVVRAGQILASGIIDTDNNGYRVTRAAGQVLARTTHTYTVSVPFSYEEKVYTGKSAREVSLLFFGADRKVFKNTGKSIEECDIIEKTIWWRIGGVTLPFGMASCELTEYTLQPAVRSAREAHALACLELEARLSAESAGRTMLSRTVETVVDDAGITLICTVVCEEDIALTAEIEA